MSDLERESGTWVCIARCGWRLVRTGVRLSAHVLTEEGCARLQPAPPQFLRRPDA